MPQAAPKPCAQPSCRALVHFSERFCEQHKRLAFKVQDERRGSSSSRGYGSQWRKAREVYLRANPLCKHCMAKRLVTPAMEVDHIVAHKGDKALFWDQGNWQALCKPCHSHKTATKDSAFAKKNSSPGGG